MGIKDAFKMDEIKKLFSNNAFVSKPLSKTSIVKLISSLNSKKQVQGMRSVVSRMQYGEDLSDLYNDIIKTIDTRNVEFKRLLNFYLVKYTQGWPAKQLICINTFLKDFGDEINEIRHSAIEDSGLLGDGTIIKNYINPLKTHGSSTSSETRCKVADSLKNYFMADPRLFCDESLSDLLKSLAFDEDPGVCACAIASIRSIEKHMKVLSASEIKKLFDRYNGSSNRKALGSLLGLMKDRPEDLFDTALLLPLLKSCDLQIFYLASSLLISADHSYKQMVFDHLRGFLDSENEELYLVLDYAQSLIADVHYENSYFVIYEDDRKYNKIKKLALLFRRLDDVSVMEIRRQCRNPELTGDILREALNVDYFVEGLFSNPSQVDKVVKILYDADSVSEKWHKAIQSFLLNAENVSEKQKYIYLCGRYVHALPLEIESIQNQNILSLVNELIRFYLNLHRRGVLSQEVVLEHLGHLQKNYLAKDRVRMVMNGLKTHGVHIFNAFCKIRKSGPSGHGLGTPNALKTASVASNIPINTSSILDIKPYYGFNEGEDRFEACSHDDLEKNEDSADPVSFLNKSTEKVAFSTDPMLRGDKLDYVDNSMIPAMEDSETLSAHTQSSGFFSNRQEEENAWLRFAESQKPMNSEECNESREVGSPMKLIDTNGLKGLLSVVDDCIVLQIDILETPLTIHYEYKSQLHSKKVEFEGSLPLSKVDLGAINSKFRMTIKKSVYELFLNIRDFIRPLDCDKDKFEREFQAHKHHILLEKFDTRATNAIDSNSFAFSVFDSKFYGKQQVNNKIILKGPKETLSLF